MKPSRRAEGTGKEAEKSAYVAVMVISDRQRAKQGPQSSKGDVTVAT
jgi:hypothetical protein